ncbi:MAG TPA: BlaI/MecI/CopY family transcriptional regulator [Blastocatellia bacterium]|nr:BlaI/MecI/CopY family transcriptional regulator [Blastocatellia bacterium]
MDRKKSIRLTRFELEIMHVLWEIGSGSVREIQERLPEKRRPAYTTVQTIVRRLEEKDAVRRLKKIGNAFIFEPLVTRKSAHHRLINELLESFGGSARPLMAHLAETGKLSLEDLKELEAMLAQRSSDASHKPGPARRDDSGNRSLK